MSRIQRIACNLGIHTYQATRKPGWIKCQTCGTVRSSRR